MLQRERLDELAQLLLAMTRSTSSNAAYAPSRFLQRLENALLGAFIVTMIVVVVVAIWYRATLPQPINGTPLTVNVIFVVGQCWAILYLVTVLVEILLALRRYRRREHGFSILAPLQKALRSDADFIARLQAFDKETLEYGLVQYRDCVETFGGRIANLVGDLRKIGLFPALVAAAIAASTLIKDGSNLFLWTPVVVTVCLYLLAFFFVNKRERPTQVIALLDYAIRYATESASASPPAADANACATGHNEKGAEAPVHHSSPRSANDTTPLPATTK